MSRRRIVPEKLVVSSQVDIEVANVLDRYVGKLGESRSAVIGFILSMICAEPKLLDSLVQELVSLEARSKKRLIRYKSSSSG